VVFLQHAKEVWILSKRDAQVRRIYMNAPHSKNPGFSWTGESVGHMKWRHAGRRYNRLDDKGPLDRYRTPHTKQMHVVERYRLNKDGKSMEVTFTVDDPGAFTMRGRVRSISAPARRRARSLGRRHLRRKWDGYGFDPDLLVPMPPRHQPDF